MSILIRIIHASLWSKIIKMNHFITLTQIKGQS